MTSLTLSTRAIRFLAGLSPLLDPDGWPVTFQAKLFLFPRGNREWFESTFSMIGKVVRAEGNVSPAAVDAAERFMNDLCLDAVAKQRAYRIMRGAASDGLPFSAHVRRYRERFGRSRRMVENLVGVLRSVAKAGKSPKGAAMVKAAFDGLGLDSADYARIKERYDRIERERPREPWRTTARPRVVRDFRHAATGDEAGERPAEPRYRDPNLRHYETLGCSPSDSDEVIKKRYRALVLECHPDRLRRAFRKSANGTVDASRFREVQEAYEQVKRARGFG